MPLAVTIETACSPVGLMHADVPHPDWRVATAMLGAGTSDDVDTALLGVDAPEDKVRRHRSRPVEGVRALVHGHFVVDEMEQIGNRWNIDTGAGCLGRTGSRCSKSMRPGFSLGRSMSTRRCECSRANWVRCSRYDCVPEGFGE